MNEDPEIAQSLRAIGEVAETLWDASLRCQDILDELAEEQLGRWAAYTALREAGAIFRSAVEQLSSLAGTEPLQEVRAAYEAGARAGLEAAADLAGAVEAGQVEGIELGIERLTLASQHFVRARHLLQQYLDLPAGEAADGTAPA